MKAHKKQAVPSLAGRRLVNVLVCHQCKHWIDELDNFEAGTDEEAEAIASLRKLIAETREKARASATSKCLFDGEDEFSGPLYAACAEDEV